MTAWEDEEAITIILSNCSRTQAEREWLRRGDDGGFVNVRSRPNDAHCAKWCHEAVSGSGSIKKLGW